MAGCAAGAPETRKPETDQQPKIVLQAPLPEDVDRNQLRRVLAHPPPDDPTLGDPADWRFDTLAWVYQQAGWRIREYRELRDASGLLTLIIDAEPPLEWVATDLPTPPPQPSSELRSPDLGPWPDPALRVIVDRDARRLYLRIDEHQVRSYPVAVGSARTPTPLQTFTVENIHHRPTWYPPPTVRRDYARRGDPLPATVPPGPANPLGDIYVQLQDRIGIHGTNRPASIGEAASYGCIRMHNADIAELSAALQIGDRVKIASSFIHTP